MEEAPIKKESAFRRWFVFFSKIAVTTVCFWYIFRKINFQEALEAILKADWWYLLLAVISFALGKLMSSYRLNIYFSNIRLRLPEWNNIRLYWLGMFYNLFLPGSISGDAYKVILLTRKFGIPYKKTTAAVLLDRFSGVLALGLIMSAYGVVLVKDPLMDIVLVAGSIGAVVALYLVIRYVFPDFLPGFRPTFFWGLAVQAMMVICVYWIMMSLHLPLIQGEWILIFLAASVISVLPISLGGGLGTRELVFVEGAKYFHLDPHIALVISLLYYLCNLLTSFWGLYFIFNDPLASTNESG